MQPSEGSDTPRFVPSTGGATESGARAGERISVPFAGNEYADDSVPVVVVEISIIPSVDIQGIMVSADKATTGTIAKISGNPAAYYLYTTINWIREDAVREGEIRFSADDGWLKEQGIAPGDVVMMGYYNSRWNELPTRMEDYTNGRYYYSARTSVFSYFAVTRKGAEVPTPQSTLASLVTTTQQIKSDFTTSPITRPLSTLRDSRTIATTSTTVPPVSYTDSAEIPAQWIVFGVAGFAGILIIVAGIRRWWIRRQNPALFRKYD
jgi:PGF-pre-PGF domain-containing protein